MTLVQQLLDAKGHEIYSVGPDDTVLTALRKMAEKDVGSMLIMSDGRLVGIFTERHYARKVFLKGRASPKTPVHEVMEKHVICVAPEQTVEVCMALMTEKRIRHLPVMRDGTVVGIVSIGDLLKSAIADQEFTIDQLEHFICGHR